MELEIYYAVGAFAGPFTFQVFMADSPKEAIEKYKKAYTLTPEQEESVYVFKTLFGRMEMEKWLMANRKEDVEKWYESVRLNKEDGEFKWPTEE